MALDYFDHLYEERFGGEVWGNIRCALLSPHKPAAFVMQHSEELVETMEAIKAFDLMQNFRLRANEVADRNFEKLESMKLSLFGHTEPDFDDRNSSNLGICYSYNITSVVLNSC